MVKSERTHVANETETIETLAFRRRALVVVELKQNGLISYSLVSCSGFFRTAVGVRRNLKRDAWMIVWMKAKMRSLSDMILSSQTRAHTCGIFAETQATIIFHYLRNTDRALSCSDIFRPPAVLRQNQKSGASDVATSHAKDKSFRRYPSLLPLQKIPTTRVSARSARGT